MTPAEARRFLLEAPRIAKIATVRADGRPHVAPIWFDLDGEDLIFTTWHTSVKAANLARDSRLALCVDDERPPYAYVILEGRARFSDDPAELFYWATRIAARYMGGDRALQYGIRNAVPGERVVRLTVERIVAQRGIAD